MEPKLFTPNPHLTDEVNSAIVKSEIDGGVWLKDLEPGVRLLVRTKNTTYFIEMGEERTLEIWGNQKYCPEPTKCTISGSTWGGSMIKVGFIGRGMRLEFYTNNHPERIVTSEIQEIIEL